MSTEIGSTHEEESSMPIHAYAKEIEAKVKHDGKLIIYFQMSSDREFTLFAFKHPRMPLARTSTNYKDTDKIISVAGAGKFVNVPIIPIQNPKPSIIDVAKATISYLVPKFLPFAEGKPIDFYHIGQQRTKESPYLRIVKDSSGAEVFYPNPKLAYIPSPKN